MSWSHLWTPSLTASALVATTALAAEEEATAYGSAAAVATDGTDGDDDNDGNVTVAEVIIVHCVLLC